VQALRHPDVVRMQVGCRDGLHGSNISTDCTQCADQSVPVAIGIPSGIDDVDAACRVPHQVKKGVRNVAAWHEGAQRLHAVAYLLKQWNRPRLRRIKLAGACGVHVYLFV
jgi:hypothetical protein